MIYERKKISKWKKNLPKSGFELGISVSKNLYIPLKVLASWCTILYTIRFTIVVQLDLLAKLNIHCTTSIYGVSENIQIFYRRLWYQLSHQLHAPVYNICTTPLTPQKANSAAMITTYTLPLRFRKNYLAKLTAEKYTSCSGVTWCNIVYKL